MCRIDIRVSPKSPSHAPPPPPAPHTVPNFLWQATPLASTASIANKTAAVLAAANAKERAVTVSLGGAKPNVTVAAATLAAHQRLKSGNIIMPVQPSAVASTAPSGTLQCLVNADGVVAGLGSGSGKKGWWGRWVSIF